jgi:tetratricopeptide (TPR) repeat protein
MTHSLSDLRDLPRRSIEVWQLAVIPLKGVRVRSGAKIGEPMACFVADRRNGRGIVIEVGEGDVADHELACQAIIAGCVKRDVGYIPGAVQIRDAAMAAQLRSRLGPRGVTVELVESLPGLDEIIAAFRKDMLPPPAPGWLDAPGMTLPRLVAYADAASAMFKAAPWQHLANEDLIQIEAPAAPAELLRFVSVMGRGGDVFGLSFISNRKDFDRLLGADDPGVTMTRDAAIALTYKSDEDLPSGDADFWAAERLPLAADNAYPLLLRYPRQSGFERVDARVITFAEGLCRALAQTSEEQFDSGRWEQAVQTCDGPITFKLSIPPLLEAMQGIKPKFNMAAYDLRARDASMLAVTRLLEAREFTSTEEMNEIVQREIKGRIPELPAPETPLEEAQWLCYKAFEYRGRRRMQLAKQALRISPDVPDAYCILAEQRGFDPAGACELYRQAVEAGRRGLGEEPFNDPEFPFWGAVESRPYMRARQGLAEVLRGLGRKEEAVAEFQALLKLNPRDNQGIRYELAPLLLELNRLDELDELLSGDDFRGDESAEWAYVRALLAFRRGAGSAKAATEIRAAIGSNPHVPKYLLGRAEMPPSPPPYFSPGDEREAMIVATSQKALWEQTGGALDWLDKCKRQINRNAKQPRGRRKR